MRVCVCVCVCVCLPMLVCPFVLHKDFVSVRVLEES